jgi:hypothetical protein
MMDARQANDNILRQIVEALEQQGVAAAGVWTKDGRIYSQIDGS